MASGNPEGGGSKKTTELGNEQGSSELTESARYGAGLPWFDLRVDHAALSNPGTLENKNEDVVLHCPELGLFGLADGMGGHASGEVAAQISIDTVLTVLQTEQAQEVVKYYAALPTLESQRAVCAMLEQTVHHAHQRVLEVGEKKATHRGMGTTLDIALFVGNRVFVAHVGDGRIFLVRPTTIVQLTHDHTRFDSLRSKGKRTPAETNAHRPLSNNIGQGKRLLVDTLAVELAPGDRLIACTDGVFKHMPSENYFTQFCRNDTSTETCQRMLAAARETGSCDDASIIAVQIGPRSVRRNDDPTSRTLDRDTLAASPLLSGLDEASLSAALAAGVEIEFQVGEEVPRSAANDRVAYLMLDGAVEYADGRVLGRSGMLMAQSLLDLTVRTKAPRVVERARMLRIRCRDFEQVCAHDHTLAAELYKRLAIHLARI